MVDEDALRVLATKHIGTKMSLSMREDAFSRHFAGGTYTVDSAACTAALRTLTATTGFNARTAASKGSK